MRALTEPLRQTDKYVEAAKFLQRDGGHVLIDGCASSQKLHLAYTLSSDPGVMEGGARYTLVLTYSDLRAHQLAEEYSFYNRNTFVFPTKDLIFYQADLRGREIERERLICLKRILEGKSAAVFTTFAALMTPLMPISLLKDSILSVRKRQALPLDKASAALTAMGYEKTYQVEAPGQFAIRGDILDIFDLTRENPCRIELWGDEVDQIRSFDVLSQRSVEELHSIDIFPATEMILRSDRLADGLARMKKECDAAAERLKRDGHVQEAHRLTEEIEQAAEQAREWGSYDSLESYIHYFYPHTEGFLSLFPPGNTMLFLDEPARVEEQANAVSMEFKESMLVRAEKGLILPGLMEFLTPVGKIAEETESFRRAGLTELAQNTSVFPTAPLVSIRAREIAPYNRSFSSLLADLKQYRKEKYRVVLFSFSRSRAKSLASELTEEGVSAFYSENPSRVLEDGEIMTYFGPIRHGFAYPACRLVVIAESDIFGGRARKKKKTKKFEGERIRDFTDLSVGDYVVHETHGIGIYRGIEKVEIDHIEKDYIKIEYAGGGTLYVLPTELDVLQKYAAQDAAKPKINKLGTQEWTNVRKKVQRAVEEIADDLVQLYAVRQQRKGHVFERDTVWQREFEELFPFEETDDQLRAIEDTKRDMESERIMDRLICGDVGYGKTEIAIRAAFKAVQDSMQAAVLVPTTILAQQHYNTFVERMKNYPVRIGLLSRFRTAAEQKKTLRALEKGEVDIVIGTHRLLSADVHFKNLGLLVVDEEQRFGVTHKEKIKKLKEDVDVLTLTATPIPRTLHMSLVGIRDMSVLEEAPEDRVPIQTYIMEYNEEMVREAILREISRGGQVYYVYNRVNDIAEVTGRLMQLVPEARFTFAHGQMSEEALEKSMYDFVNGETDVLVSTTIIETGLDISNVNTMIVHDADRMGLSQLYQLRGRVGRSDRTAYAFLMYRRGKLLKEEAQKRLSAIRDFTELGSGFRIAMRDLEIRGAGNLLGHAQHGHMQAVGYDLYCKLLDTAVKKAKGIETKKEQSASVNLSADAFIPESYILNEAQKMDIYKKIALIGSTEDLEDIRAELLDRFGQVPASAENLLRIALIRAIAGRLDISDITGYAGTIRFTFQPQADVKVEGIPSLLKIYGGALTFAPRPEPSLTYRFKPTGVTVRDEEMLLSMTEDVLVKISEQLRQ